MVDKILADKPQREKFIDKARELESDEDESAFEGRLRKIVAAPKHKSDCAVHNAPAMKPGRCTCGAIKGEQ